MVSCMGMSVFLLLLLLGCFQSTVHSTKKKIYIGGLIPSYTMDLYGFKAAIDIATEIVNNRTDILKDYEIIIKYGDTYGQTRYTVSRLIEFIQEENMTPLKMIIGPAWSKNAVVSSIICETPGLIQISYGASNYEFHTDEAKYRLLFTNVPTASSYNRARLALIKHFGWKTIAVLREFDDKLFSQTILDLQEQIKSENLNITLTTIEGFSYNVMSHPRIQLEKLRKLDARIIIGEFSTLGASRVFCEAYKMGMFGPKYVWLLSSSLSRKWIFDHPLLFKKAYPSVTCNVSVVAEATAGFIIVDRIPIREDNETTASGLTAQAFLNETKKRNVKAQAITSYAFDALWAAALTLNKSLSEKPEYHPENISLISFMGRMKYRTLLGQTEFEGITGPHRFYGRQRVGTVRVSQMRLVDGKAKLFQFGRHNTFNDELVLYEDEVKNLWKDGKVPVDEPTKENEILKYSLVPFQIITVFSVLGILYSLAFLYFNITRRKHKVVRLSSPLINNIILLGCLLCYIFVLLLGIDSRFVADHVLGTLCNVRLYMLAIAFSLSFGALFSKTWRVHKIFTAQRAIKKKMMRDIHLILFVVFLVVIDVIFITAWVYYDPLKPKEIIFEEKKETPDLVIIPILKICECSHFTQLLGGLYAYKGILLLFGVFLAWETRNVTIPALNDSKYIGVSVYNVVILSAIGVAVSMTLKETEYYELLYVVVSTVVVLSTTFTLTILFLPKLYEYYFTEPEPQERTRTFATLKGSSVTSSTTEITDVYEAVVKRDVKDKWVQTEDFGPVDPVGPPSYHEQDAFQNQVPNYDFYENIEDHTGGVDNLGISEDNPEPTGDLSQIMLHEKTDDNGSWVEDDITVHTEHWGSVVNNGCSMDEQGTSGAFGHGDNVDNQNV